MLQRETALRSAWNKDRFGEIGTTKLIHQAITSDLFWGYARFLKDVAGLVDIQSSFCEGCSCHEHDGLKHNSFQIRAREIKRRLLSAIDGDTQDRSLPYLPSCPLKNRRSAELANGEFKRFIEETVKVTTEKLITSRGPLGDSDWKIIAGDWMSAQESRHQNFKTQNWCGGYHVLYNI